MEIKMTQITEFLKLLVEWGGVYSVKEDDMSIVTASDNNPVLIDLNGTHLPLHLFSEKNRVGKYTFFNPLVETLGHSKERTWFVQSRSLIAGNIIKRMMIQIVELTLKKEDDDLNYDILDIVQPFVDKTDSKLIKEIEKIPAINLLRIIYNKRHRTAQVQSDIWDEEFREKMNFRKRSWDILTGLLTSILGTDDEAGAIENQFKHKATIVSMQEADAFLHVMFDLTVAIHQYVHVLLGLDLHALAFEQHMDNLEQYRKACAWAISGTVEGDRQALKPEEVASVSSGVAVTDPSHFVPLPHIQPQPVTISPVVHQPTHDPMALARMASIIRANPHMDANSLFGYNQTPNQYGGSPTMAPYQRTGGFIGPSGPAQFVPTRTTISPIPSPQRHDYGDGLTRIPPPKR